MKRKFILGILMALSISIVGCDKVENEVNKEVIVIDDDTKETIEKNKSLALNLKFQGYIEKNNEVVIKSEDEYEYYYFLEDSLFRFTLKLDRKPMAQFGIQNIVKAEMRKINLNSRNEDLSKGEWKELDISGNIMPGGLISRTFKIRKDNKVYDLLADGSLKELEAYNGIYDYIKDHPFSQEVYNTNLNSFDLSELNKKIIINEKTDEYFEIEDVNSIKNIPDNHFIIFDASEDRIYAYSLKDRENKNELIIGYIENNEFYNLFENEEFTIINQAGFNLNNTVVIKNKNSIVFAGTIDSVNGIWNYNLENKKITLQMEIEKGFETAEILMPNEENLIITNYKRDLTNSSVSDEEKEENIIYSLAKVNENLEIEEILDITEIYKSINLDNFSEDGKEVYLSYFDEEENKMIYEIYEISN